MRNVRRCWPASPRHFERVRLPSLGRAAERSSRYVVNNGLSFQRRLTQAFQQMGNFIVLPELGFTYLGSDGKQYRAYADIVLVDPLAGYVIVVEAKRTHTARSYEQIWFYMAMLQSRFGSDFKVFGFEACSLAGRQLEYPGACVWAHGDTFDLESIEWDGKGMPRVGILPCYMNYYWRFTYGQESCNRRLFTELL